MPETGWKTLPCPRNDKALSHTEQDWLMFALQSANIWHFLHEIWLKLLIYNQNSCLSPPLLLITQSLQLWFCICKETKAWLHFVALPFQHQHCIIKQDKTRARRCFSSPFSLLSFFAVKRKNVVPHVQMMQVNSFLDTQMVTLLLIWQLSHYRFCMSRFKTQFSLSLTWKVHLISSHQVYSRFPLKLCVSYRYKHAQADTSHMKAWMRWRRHEQKKKECEK